MTSIVILIICVICSLGVSIVTSLTISYLMMKELSKEFIKHMEEVEKNLQD